ncbi:MAG: redox-sensing transcriptional repressor Rex [Eubacteriales bacterium]
MNNIPDPTLRRLPMYYQYLVRQRTIGQQFVSCTNIAEELNLVSVQVRKDLQSAGAVGKPKVGYEVKQLIGILEETLGYNYINEAFLVGMGNLGQALAAYREFEKCGMEIVATFDNSPLKIGRDYFGKRVFPLNKFENLAQRMNIKIGIITTPAQQAQEVADLMVSSGIEGIWNFAPIHLNVPKDVVVQNENLGAALSVFLSKARK